MKSPIQHLALLFITCFSFACNSQPKESKSILSASEIQTDYQLFRQALEEAHPGLYSYTSKSEFDRAFELIGSELNENMSKQEFYKKLTPLITKTGCGHVKFFAGEGENFKYPYNSSQLLPLKLLVNPRGTYLHYTYGDNNSIPAGSEILSIDGRPIKATVDSLLHYVTFADGTATDSKYLELSNYFSGYYAAFIEASPTYSIKYLTPEGIENNTELAAVPLVTIEKTELAASANKAGEPLSLTISGGTAVMKISSFWFEDKTVNLERFLKNSFSSIKEKNISSLVIDLRDNEGGKDSYGALLYSYLTDAPFSYYKEISTNTNKRFSFADNAKQPWYFFFYRQLLKKGKDGRYLWKRHDNLKKQQPQENAYLGDVYILINGRSFSVTSEFSAIAYSNKRATFIGQETGGGYLGNNSGFFTIVTLPNSGFILGIPLWRYELAVNSKLLKKGGIIPHHPTERKIEDVLNRMDREMMMAREIISKKSTGSLSSFD